MDADTLADVLAELGIRLPDQTYQETAETILYKLECKGNPNE